MAHAAINESEFDRALYEEHFVVVGIANHADAGENFFGDVGIVVAAVDGIEEVGDVAVGAAFADGHGAEGVAGLETFFSFIDAADEEQVLGIVDRAFGGGGAAVERVVDGGLRIGV